MNRITKIFTGSVLNWFAAHGRKDLPWQNPYSDYRVWISEIMLQQTQVKTVIPYFLRFMAQYPSIESLAHASIDDVLTLWSGLGYYSRARNLHQTAQTIVSQHQGRFPQDLKTLQTLPGIGPSTAAAIASLAYNLPTAILDGNVKRVLSRYFLISGNEAALWQQAQACMPQENCREYTQAIMDMGATCCTQKNPHCSSCPLQPGCQAYQKNIIAEYPAKKPKKILPTRSEQFLILHREDHKIYLEQRPHSGIWGGLWCLPCLAIEDCAKSHLKHLYALKITEINPVMNLKHSFTHFHLKILASSVNIPSDHPLPGRWVSFEELDQLGLAKPIRTIVDYFFKDFKKYAQRTSTST